MSNTQIALLGVPGSGKSDLATALAESLERADIGGCGCRTPVMIIDDYVPTISESTGLATGFLGDYVVNLHIALERARLERISSAKTTITCGTLIETATYVTIEGIAALKLQDEDERLDTAKRLESTMKTLACLYMDTFHYDAAFYLPMIVVPEGVDAERASLLDKHLQTAFQAFSLVPVIPLMVGEDVTDITQERCRLATEHILGVPVES